MKDQINENKSTQAGTRQGRDTSSRGQTRYCHLLGGEECPTQGFSCQSTIEGLVQSTPHTWSFPVHTRGGMNFGPVNGNVRRTSQTVVKGLAFSPCFTTLLKLFHVPNTLSAHF